MYSLQNLCHSATTAKLSNWASSNECVPIAAQPFCGVRTTAFFHSGYPFSCPDAYWPCEVEGENEWQRIENGIGHMHERRWRSSGEISGWLIISGHRRLLCNGNNKTVVVVAKTAYGAIFWLCHLLILMSKYIICLLNVRMTCKQTKVCFQRREDSTSSHHCCVPQCTASATCNSVVSFRTFPKNTELQKWWVINIRRDNFIVTNSSRVCSRHFQSSDLSYENVSASNPSQMQTFEKWSCPTTFPVEQLHYFSPMAGSLGKDRATQHRANADWWAICGGSWTQLLRQCWACCARLDPRPCRRAQSWNSKAPKTNRGDKPQKQVLFGTVCWLWWGHKVFHKVNKISAVFVRLM